MSKIICDICGTSYPETAAQCPICGCIRPGDVQRVTNEIKSDGKVSTGYTYVKGGRFSKTNVKKRTQAQNHAAAETKEKPAKPNKNKEEPKEEKNNIGLVITAVVLLLAIIGVVIYISVRFFMPADPNHGGTTGAANQNMQIACTDLKLDTDTVLFEQLGEARLLQVSVEPFDTTDSIHFRSMDESIISVNEVGKITAVAEGSTKIVITCGQVTKECTVTCQIPTETTVPLATEDATAPSETVIIDEDFRLNRVDMTLDRLGAEWNLYDGKIDKTQITWTSDDEKVATFVEGKVVAVGPGMTEVHAAYQGQKVSCIVRCVFKDSTGVEGSGGVSEDGGGTPTPDGGSGNTSGAVTGTIQVAKFLNVRSGPGINNEKVGEMKPGEKVTITEQQKGEDGILWGKTSAGWISMDYVILD